MASNDVVAMIEEISKDAVACTRAANSFLSVSSGELEYLQSFPQFRSRLQGCATRCLSLIETVMSSQRPNASRANLRGMNDIEEQFEVIVDFSDRQLEKVDGYIEDISGSSSKSKRWISDHVAGADGHARAMGYARVLEESVIVKPQLKFQDYVDNSNTPFVPKLHKKIHHVDPKERLKMEPPVGAETHPYLREICTLGYTGQQLAPPKAEIPPLALHQAPCTWIDNEVLLQNVIQVLENEKEFAIDVENHSLRSFQGFCCLMQISTRNADYLIDLLELRSSAHLLLGVFTDPKITKVMHSAQQDIKWLQRDFGLYIVNLFDTGVAARVLNLGHNSLAHLMKQFCQIEPDKQYHKADWRVRPIPSDMIKAARESTHYLLYIFDRLKTLLAPTNQIPVVLQQSQEVCLSQYEKELISDDSHLILLTKSSQLTTPQQTLVFSKLFQWRDRVARQEDESVRYVTTDKSLFAISQQLPVDKPSLFACCKTTAPPLLRAHTDEILAIVHAALAEFEGSMGQPLKRAAAQKPMLSVASPVPTADQLYATVGWIEKANMLSGESGHPSQLAGMVTPQALLFDNSFEVEDPEDDEDDRAEQERDRISSNLATSDLLTFPQMIHREASLTNENVGLDDDDDKHPKSAEHEEIPRSMSEIYSLSNRNRKRNKERKKKKDDADNALEEGAESDEDGGDQKRARDLDSDNAPSVPLPDATEFMKDIGWLKHLPPGQAEGHLISRTFDYAAAAAKGLAFQGGHVQPNTFEGVATESSHNPKNARQQNPRVKSVWRGMTFKQGRTATSSTNPQPLQVQKSGGGGGGRHDSGPRWPHK